MVKTNSEQITASSEALGHFLAALPVLSGPWDGAFHRMYCDACAAEECTGCEHMPTNTPLWWLDLPAEREETQK